MAGTGGRLLPALLLLLVAGSLAVALGATDPQDAAAVRALLSNWQNAPPSWGNGDPCDTPWDGLSCANSRVISLKLSSMGIKGTLSSDIALLTELNTLDLSYNSDLGGPLTSNIGSLTKLNTLILLGCGFTGPIPGELGNLPLLTYISLNNNKFTGTIPASLGKLANLYWLDLAENQLSGPLPVSSGDSPGLDRLFGTKHFHFNKNQLSGNIPPQIFNPNMTLIHILFDQNQLTGGIPDSIGLVKTLEVLRLDRNQLNGTIPSSINNLTRVNEVHLANNRLSGTIPDLSGMSRVNYLDLSNNSFTPSEAPAWFTKLSALTTLVIDGGRLGGLIPIGLFSIPQLQKVSLKNNSFNGTLDLTGTISQQLQLIDLRDNDISIVPPGNRLRTTVMLYGNPYCTNPPPGNAYCLPELQMGPAYITSLGKCSSTSCSQDQSVNPGSCVCAYPYKGTMVFRAPLFSDLINSTRFQSLESSLWTTLRLSPGAVYLQNILFNSDNYLQIQVSLFPSEGILFNRSEIQRLGFFLSNQTYKPPAEFGPYYFIAFPYNFAGSTGGGNSSMSTGAVVGIAVACSILIIGLLLVGLYALKQKRKAKKAIQTSHPFASWVPSGSDQASAPELKGARWFSFDDLRKCTSNFSESNLIGSGGYGKVYRGTLSSGQMVAIKRAEQGSMQGALEFKTEIELLSRLHHKNLVGLVGFCYDKGEQMLVYEYVPNGTLRENLSGETGIHLDWKRRLRIALGSARGLAYLHELADPPIIHRDVKSSNILLDEELNAKVADFGLSKLISDTEKGHVSTQVKGTLGYLDPEYYMTQQLTDKSDVYSFGVVLLELITAKLPIEKGKYVVREFRTALNTRDGVHYGLDQLMDPTIRDTPFIAFSRFVDLALQCVGESAVERPSMNEVVREIETILQLEGSNPASAASSATEFMRGNPPRHPYNGQLPTREMTSTESFENSSVYTISATMEPK